MDLKERGISKDTAAAVEETMMTARDTAETIKETPRQTAQTAPQTSGTIRNAGKVTSKTRKGTKTILTQPIKRIFP